LTGLLGVESIESQESIGSVELLATIYAGPLDSGEDVPQPGVGLIQIFADSVGSSENVLVPLILDMAYQGIFSDGMFVESQGYF
jgi:hypothetical protein